MSVFVIAEAGSTHDNSLDKALRLIRCAAEVGSSAVKFQVCTNIDKLMAKRGEKPEARPAYEYLKTTKEWLPRLKEEAVKVGIKFGCTAFIEEDIPLVAQYVDFFKVAAKESGDAAFMDAHFPYAKPMIASEREGHEAHWSHLTDVRVMYCVSEYPTPIEHLKLHRIWEKYDGLSDHSTSTLTGALAVALGATVIEKHIRLWDTETFNPDFPHSMICEPTAVYSFAEYVSNIRHAEKCL